MSIGFLALCAFIPILLALILMAGLRWPSTRAMPLSWLVGALIAWAVWDIAPMRLVALSIEGTITAIGLFYTTLLAADGKEISIPTSEVCASRVTDYTREPERRVELGFDMGYDCAAEDVRAALLAALAADGRALSGEGHEPAVVLSEYRASSVRYLLRFWVNNRDYWAVCYAVNESARGYLARAGLSMAYDRLDVHIVK